MAGSQVTLDAPDLNVRAILLKKSLGGYYNALSPRELRRLAVRESVEQETARVGGVIRSPITSAPETPYDFGRRLAEEEQGYRAGYAGFPRRLGEAPATGAQTPTGRVPGDPIRDGTQSDPVPPAAPAGASTSEQTAALRRTGPVDVNSYRGSMWKAPGTEAAPAAPSTREAAADAALKRRFGPSPADRGQVDIAGASGTRSVAGPGAGESTMTALRRAGQPMFRQPAPVVDYNGTRNTVNGLVSGHVRRLGNPQSHLAELENRFSRR